MWSRHQSVDPTISKSIKREPKRYCNWRAPLGFLWLMLRQRQGGKRRRERRVEREIAGERGELMWKISLIRWNVCPLPQIPSCGAREKKRPKLMSLGRTICLSGLLLRDKKLLFASVPFQCPWLWRMWRWMKGGAKDFWRVLLYADVMAGLAFGRWNPQTAL